MAKHKVVIGILILVFILGILLFLSWVSLSERKFVAYDTGSYRPDGLKALNLLMLKSGYRVSTIDKIPDHHQKLLILISTGLSSRQQRKILDWVNAGGTIVELNSAEPGLEVDKYHLSRLNSKAGRACQAYQPTGWPATLRYHLSGGWVTVKTDPEQGFYGVGHRYFIYRQSYGAGQLVIWNDLGGLTNRFLKYYPDNAAIFVSLIREFSSLSGIDFYNLAFQDDNISTAGWKPARAFNHYWGGGLLLGLGIILLVWKLAARFGRPRPLNLVRGRSYDEFVYSMAGLFQQAK
ncbi:MAG TPA: hypothetical protein DDW50_01375, partial [Firmicutes bacterium]|nr:hypothetical protein [Bacillota bacterium]